MKYKFFLDFRALNIVVGTIMVSKNLVCVSDFSFRNTDDFQVVLLYVAASLNIMRWEGKQEISFDYCVDLFCHSSSTEFFIKIIRLFYSHNFLILNEWEESSLALSSGKDDYCTYSNANNEFCGNYKMLLTALWIAFSFALVPVFHNSLYTELTETWQYNTSTCYLEVGKIILCFARLDVVAYRYLYSLEQLCAQVELFYEVVAFFKGEARIRTVKMMAILMKDVDEEEQYVDHTTDPKGNFSFGVTFNYIDEKPFWIGIYFFMFALCDRINKNQLSSDVYHPSSIVGIQMITTIRVREAIKPTRARLGGKSVDHILVPIYISYWGNN